MEDCEFNEGENTSVLFSIVSLYIYLHMCCIHRNQHSTRNVTLNIHCLNELVKLLIKNSGICFFKIIYIPFSYKQNSLSKFIQPMKIAAPHKHIMRLILFGISMKYTLLLPSLTIPSPNSQPLETTYTLSFIFFPADLYTYLLQCLDSYMSHFYHLANSSHSLDAPFLSGTQRQGQALLFVHFCYNYLSLL